MTNAVNYKARILTEPFEVQVLANEYAELCEENESRDFKEVEVWRLAYLTNLAVKHNWYPVRIFN